MPGPPPPSKSYSIKIIDSSDEEDDDDDDDDHHEEEEVKADNYDSVNNTRGERSFISPMIVKDSTMDINNAKDDHDGTGTGTSIITPTETKKKRKKKTKKKKKRSANSKTAATTTTREVEMQEPEKKKCVTFDVITVHSFERALGTGVVPCDGGWPLGLGKEIFPVDSNHHHHQVVESCDIETYESAKQERLRIRAKQKGIPLLAPDVPFCTTCNVMDDDDATTIPVLETRQWDYKHKARNPLFHLIQEEQRMNVLLMSSTPEETTDVSSSSHHVNAGGMVAPNKHRDSASNKGSTDKKRQQNTKTKHGSNNNNNNGHPQSGHHSHHGLHHTGHHINTRSSSNNHSKRERSGSVSNPQEHYNDAFTQVEVHRVRNELEELRFHRSGEGHVGCTCRKLDVYLLPPDGGGKKAHHRRMNVKRVKDELRKRHLLPDVPKTREELELLLHTAVEKEPCCSGQDCPCARNGIECQADVCSCWHDSHQSKEVGASTSSKNETDAVDTIVARCGNVHGMYVVDFPKIQAYRDRVLNAIRGNAGCIEKRIDTTVVPMEQD
jgi:hypothetical protein